MKAEKQIELANWVAEQVNPDEERDFGLGYIEDADILYLRDRRRSDRSKSEWCGFRNYLYGWHCQIIGEHRLPDCDVMLIDAARDMLRRLGKHFGLLSIEPQPERSHSIWGRVAVEDGQPIGLYQEGHLVRQTIDRPWPEYS